MKKLWIIVISSLVFLFTTSLVCFIVSYVNFSDNWGPFIIGTIILVFSLILLVIYLKKKVRPLLFIMLLLNAVAFGFYIRTWHLFRNYNLDLFVLFTVSILCIIYLLVFYAFSLIPLFSRYYKAYLIIFLILSIGAYVILIATTKTTFLSTYGYYMIIEIGFVLALSVETHNKKELLEAITYSTFSIIIAGIIIALIMLEADIDLDFIDFDILSIKNQREKKKL